jgi:hypothetical protein
MRKRRNIMTVKNFVDAYKAKKFMIIKNNGVDEKSEWLRKELEIKEYIPFREKRKIAEMIVEQNVEEVDGIKKYDSISGYVSLVVASISAHTNLEFSTDPVADYDLLAESGLLPLVVGEFQGSHGELDIILKMALEMELKDNETSALVGRFLNQILGMLDGVSDVLKGVVENIDLEGLLGDIKPEDLAKLSGLLDKLN